MHDLFEWIDSKKCEIDTTKNTIFCIFVLDIFSLLFNSTNVYRIMKAKVDPDDEDPIGCEFNYVFVFVMQLQYFWSSWYQSENYSHES